MNKQFPRCPRCQGEWFVMAPTDLRCDQCKMKFSPTIQTHVHHTYDYLEIIFNNIAVLWWVNLNECDIWINQTKTNFKYLLPYDITLEQLQLYLTFS